MDLDSPPQPETARDRFERIHTDLQTRICLLDYPPGARLSEQALAEEFGVSRTPLRRVLVRLEGEGLLQSVQGVGTFVTEVSLEELVPVYELRLELADLLGRLGPQQPDAGLWARMQEIGDLLGELADSPAPEGRRFGELNLAFFRAFHQITTNAPLRVFSERLFFQTSRLWLKTMAAGEVDVATEARIFQHEVGEVLRPLAIGDIRSATLIHRSHISMSFIRMKRAAGRLD
ncbi:MAG: GntR family transcriptional regulator [Rubellimicrobium sp.]|nr:GntR family transcriptional regulator [Rubellimicrobium sp.]